MSAAPTNVSFYADLQGISQLRRGAQQNDPNALREAARQFESLFTHMLLKSMRETSFGDPLFGSEQTQFYQGMFDEQMALHLSQGKGLGLAEMLVRQLSSSGGRISNDGDVMRPTANATSDTANPEQTKAEFIATYLPHAQQAAASLGVTAEHVLAQAALETGWGRSVPRTPDGHSSHNLFGIKTGEHWRGATVSVKTLEFEQGIPVVKRELFRAYSSPADCFADYAALLRNSPRYAAVLNRTDAASFAQALQQAGYATDPKYADKVSAIAEKLAEKVNSLKFAQSVSLTQG